MNSKKNILVYTFFLLSVFCTRAQPVVDAGPYKTICPGGQVTIGGHPTASGGSKPYTYSWTPSASLNYPDSANPVAHPTATTHYTVFVKDLSGKTQQDTVTVYVYPYSLTVNPDSATIHQGQTITLHAQAPNDSAVYWSATSNIYNANTLNPDVFPTATTTYSLTVAFPHHCFLYIKVKVTVLPSTELYFYNSFTPNGDGANDYFYIGNIGDYPNNTLEIYNRYGQKIFNETGYNNDWDGKYLGTDLPSGTYFYILDTHDTAGKFKGEINIIR